MGKMVVFTEKLVIPRIWEELLAIASFEALPVYPAKAYGHLEQPGHLIDPTPYRDDDRQVFITNGIYTIYLHLLSGDGNYWLSYEVWRQGESEGDYLPETFYNLPQGRDEFGWLGVQFSFDTVLV